MKHDDNERPNIAPRPKSEPQAAADWIRDLLPDLAACAAEAESHATFCTAANCERCGRWACRGCGVPGNSRQCDRCRAAEVLTMALADTRRSMPARFGWALDPTPEALAQRIQYDQRKVRQAIDAAPRVDILFLGPSGVGKTSLAVAMAGAWVRRYSRPAVFAESGILSRARARYRLGAGEAPMVEACMDAPLLVLDDLGQEREDRDGCISDVVYDRHNRGLPTWVTCGLPYESLDAFSGRLSARYDGGFARRISEIGRQIHMGGGR